MRLLIVGSLNGQLTAATRIAMDKGASVLQADTIDTALRTLRSGRGADLVMIDVSLPIPRLITSLEEERREMVTAIRRDATATDVDAFLKRLVTERLNIIVSGGTSTGKTELGRRLLSLVPENERIVTIEDSLELLPAQPNAVSLIAQRDDSSARSADKLLQATLRLRPDRIILGELRGSEAATFLDAINTGHSGSFTTLHAHSARKAMDRLALLVMAQGTRLSFAEVIRYLETSIDVILQMGRQGECRGIMEMYFPGLED